MSFDPNSTDSMFAKILARLDAQDATLARIDSGVSKTNGRVNSLEKWRDVVTAKTAVIGAGIAFCVTLAMQYFFR